MPNMSSPTVRKVAADLDPESFDRCDFLPRHEGPTILPHDLLFHDLYSLAVAQNTTAVKDMNDGHSVSHQQLLSDILRLSARLREELHPQSWNALQDEREVPFLVLSEGYEAMVAFFAVWAVGGIAVPLSESLMLGF